MRGMLKAVWLGSVLALVVALIGVRILFAEQFGWGLFLAIIILVFIAALTCYPLAGAISGGLINKLYAPDKGKTKKDYSRAKWLATQGQFEEAISEFRLALEEEPEDLGLRLEIADIYSREMKDFRRAISELQVCLTLPISTAQAASVLNRIADIYETNLGDTEAAIATLSKIIRNWPRTKFAQRAEQRVESLRREAGNSTGQRPTTGPEGAT